jgi:hypothetical protein
MGQELRLKSVGREVLAQGKGGPGDVVFCFTPVVHALFLHDIAV